MVTLAEWLGTCTSLTINTLKNHLLKCFSMFDLKKNLVIVKWHLDFLFKKYHRFNVFFHNFLLQKEPLHFNINPDDYRPEVAHVIIEIKKVEYRLKCSQIIKIYLATFNMDITVFVLQLAESLLYHWKSFPIVLPLSITQRHEDEVCITTFWTIHPQSHLTSPLINNFIQ